MKLYQLPPGRHVPEVLTAVIEVPKDSSNKFEYDPEYDIIRLDRVLYSAVHYPGDYGFIPSTLAEDGDPLDITVMIGRPSFPGAVLDVRPLGFLEMTDDKGRDQKILAVPVFDPRFNSYNSLQDVGPHYLKEIENFFEIYKQLEHKETIIEGWHDVDEAHKLVLECVARHKDVKGSK
jgi:inorganic pyrophosphatase